MHDLIEFFRPHLLPLLYAVVIVALLPLVAGYIVLLERKVMADMQARLGPMRVGPHGLLQPIADALKLLIKEDIIPESADAWIFWFAPVISVTTAMLAMAALAFGPSFQIAKDINVGILFVVGVSALGIFGIVLGGWASNSHYSLLGALRSSAQLVIYETAGGMAIVSGLLLSRSLRIRGIVEMQNAQHVWFVFLAPITFFIYMVASIAGTNRARLDLPEAACPGPETVHGCRGWSVPAARGGVGAAAICSGGEFPRGPQTRGSRRILVPVESVFVSLRFYVAAVHAAALPLRPVDEAGLALPDPGFHCQRDEPGAWVGAVLATALEAVGGAAADHGDHPGDCLVADRWRDAAKHRRSAKVGCSCWIAFFFISLRESRYSPPSL